jgi:hypothetical protein
MNDEHPLVEAFLEGRLSPLEEAVVHKRIGEDFQFRKMVDDEILLRSVVSDKESQVFMQQVREVMDQKTAMKKITGRFLVVSIAAVILVLLGVFFIQVPERNFEDIFLAHFEPYPMILAQRNEQSAVVVDLIEDYNQRRWDQVEADLLALPENTLSKPRIDLYLGIAALAQKRPLQAIEILEPYASNRVDNLDQEMLAWYLILAHLANDDVIMAKANLNDLLKILPNGRLRSDCLSLAKDL